MRQDVMTNEEAEELKSAAYDQGVEDGIRQERERIREALLRDEVVERLIWTFRGWRQAFEEVLASIGLGEESEVCPHCDGTGMVPGLYGQSCGCQERNQR